MTGAPAAASRSTATSRGSAGARRHRPRPGTPRTGRAGRSTRGRPARRSRARRTPPSRSGPRRSRRARGSRRRRTGTRRSPWNRASARRGPSIAFPERGPIHDATTSVIATSMCSPSPVRRRFAHAAQIARAATVAAARSAIGTFGIAGSSRSVRRAGSRPRAPGSSRRGPGSAVSAPDLPVAAHRAVDDLRVDRLHVLVADAQPVGDTGPPAFAEHVGLRGELERARAGPRASAGRRRHSACATRRRGRCRETCASDRGAVVRASTLRRRDPRAAASRAAPVARCPRRARACRRASPGVHAHAITPSARRRASSVVVAAGELAQHRVGARAEHLGGRQVDPPREADRQRRAEEAARPVGGRVRMPQLASAARARATPDRPRPRSAPAPARPASRSASNAASTSRTGRDSMSRLRPRRRSRPRRPPARGSWATVRGRRRAP